MSATFFIQRLQTFFFNFLHVCYFFKVFCYFHLNVYYIHGLTALAEVFLVVAGRVLNPDELVTTYLADQAHLALTIIRTMTKLNALKQTMTLQ